METCPDFSHPIVEQLTEWILNWEPDLAETIKWNMLCFSGRKLVCGLSACKHHVGVTFFRGTELHDPRKLFGNGRKNNTNIRTVRITALQGFNREAFRALLHAAVNLDSDPTIPPAPKMKRKPWPMPVFFKEALAQKQNRAAAEGFRKLAPVASVNISSGLRPPDFPRRNNAGCVDLSRH